MEQDYSALPYIITNIVSVVTVICAMIWPTVSRVLLSTIFVGAFAINLFTAFMNPWAYLEFGELTTSDFYRPLRDKPATEG